FGPAADHPPLAALVLTPVSWLTNNSIMAQRLTMALLGTATIIVLGLLGRRVGGDRVGWLAAAIAVVNANLWMNDGLVMSESVAALCIALTLLVLYKFHDSPTWRWTLWLGLICGVTILARAEMALFIPIAILPVALLARSLPLGQRVARFFVVGGVALAVLAPWSLWNLTRFERPVPISSNDGITLVGANCAPSYYEGVGFWNLNCRLAADAKLPPNADQSVVSAQYRDEAFQFIRDNKRAIPHVAEIRLRRLWNLYYPDQMVWLNQGEGREQWASWTGVYMADVLFLLSIFGAVWLWKRRVPVWPLLATAVIASVTAVVFYGIARFRLPADLAACVLAAVAVEEIARRVRSWWRRNVRPRSSLPSAADLVEAEAEARTSPPGVTERSAG